MVVQGHFYPGVVQTEGPHPGITGLRRRGSANTD